MKTSAEYFETWARLADIYGWRHGLTRMAWTFYQVAVERERIGQ